MSKLLFLDVDGTMTNSLITYYNNGGEIKSFNTKDGFAIVSWLRLGFEVAIITGRKSIAVQRRAEELGVRYLYQGCGDKLSVLQTLNKDFAEIYGVGDDLNDLQALKFCKRSFCPSDASDFLKPYCTTVLTKKGGEGAVAEAIEILILDLGLKKDYVSKWQ
ncbi:MAG: KdsC family phosphatase [Helicobacteraceae bacterium]